MAKKFLTSVLLSTALASPAYSANYLVKGTPPSPDSLGTLVAQKDPGAQLTAAPQSSGQAWVVTPADQNLRMLLNRWASAAGWTVVWKAERDSPVEGSAQFAGDFKRAVRDLLQGTEGTDQPLQPCFHTNAVIRVISARAVCDRTE
ncbi:hypothetical protein BKK79_36725 (plasmid) [Cupriavidus sp. USMAA2-4]|uniref:toxin co-regulated pilus biosynthesis Q family protein n=1 Tax=Cupriavidus sp. USMAA2-4 TaxID=876364 RepID=UPI0008A6F352|nr:toxin co-regulated pilus biosynthesis Q family protein [Cupriavidus sp. USMAA2-4]AOY97495.1 hypothetical protein BKK79_36725 [Cupriavidus sp. USMAA2-4]